jgi:hypothetical protein
MAFLSASRACFLLLVAIGITSGPMAFGGEQLCDNLGSICICSEPFQMTGFMGGPDFWNPNDTSLKECSAEQGVTGGAVVRTSNTITVSSDATALAALPAGSQVKRFVRANDNHEGTFTAGNGVPISSSVARLAARFYIYHTPTFDFQGEGTCYNSKQAQLDGGVVIDFMGADSNFHTYNYLQFSPAVDCCMSGPGPNGISAASMKGKWIRHEIILTRRSGPGFRLQLYIKNISDGTPEQLVIDTAMDSRVNNLTPPKLMSAILSNNHRWSGDIAGNSCRGWIGLSHYLMAGWGTDNGQRIGPSLEFEGTGAPAPSPSPDTTPPSVTILSPTSGSNVARGTPGSF